MWFTESNIVLVIFLIFVLFAQFVVDKMKQSLNLLTL